VELSDGDLTTSQTVSVTVLNDAPTFTVNALQNQRMRVNKTLDITFNNFYDTEGNTVIMSFEEIVGGVATALPVFATQSGSYQITFNPIPFSTLGVHTFKVILSDSLYESFLTFDLEIYNTAPYFSHEVPVDQTMRLNNSLVYKLPHYKDDEGNPVTILVLPEKAMEFITID
jgi:hypothetical protein